jgi:hypothetical protein
MIVKRMLSEELSCAVYLCFVGLVRAAVLLQHGPGSSVLFELGIASEPGFRGVMSKKAAGYVTSGDCDSNECFQW